MSVIIHAMLVALLKVDVVQIHTFTDLGTERDVLWSGDLLLWGR